MQADKQRVIATLQVIEHDGRVFVESDSPDFQQTSAPIRYTGAHGVQDAVLEAMYQLSCALRGQWSKGELQKWTVQWCDRPAEDVMVGFSHGSSNGDRQREVRFQDGRHIAMTSAEWFALVQVAMHDASVWESLMIQFRRSMIANFAGDFLKAADEMRKRLAEIAEKAGNENG